MEGVPGGNAIAIVFNVPNVHIDLRFVQTERTHVRAAGSWYPGARVRYAPALPMLDPTWIKALVEAARRRLWTGDASAASPGTLLRDAGLRPPATEAERLLLLGIVADLRQKALAHESSDTALSSVVAYIRAHSRNRRLSRAQAARALALSDSWIGHRFKAQLGLPFSRFVTNLRLDDGAELLRTTDASVKQIALTVGFGNPGSFTRSFTARFGVAPTTWRRAASPQAPTSEVESR